MNLNFPLILAMHSERYPKMTAQDYIKLVYQSEFGPRHMLDNYDSAIKYIDKEWSENENCKAPLPEPIGNGLCRFYMGEYSESASELLGELFYLTAKEHQGTVSGLYDKLKEIEWLFNDEIREYKAKGCPAVHHSKEYNEAYKPHYRLLKWEYACYFDVLLKIKNLRKPAVISIDGRCGSGKTSLASLIKTLFDCNVFHIDDYYLPLSQRKPDWEQLPAGNIDLLRFKNEVLEPLRLGETVKYRPYDCCTGEFKAYEAYAPKELNIIEGSYSQHTMLSDYYDLKIFLTSSKDVQAKRLIEREGDYYEVFLKRWIPMEELYLSSLDIESKSDILINTSNIF